MNLGNYRRSLDVIMQATLSLVLRMIPALWTPTEDQDDRQRQIASMAPILAEQIRARRREAYRVAVEFLDAQAHEHTGSPGAVSIPEPPEYTDEAMRTVLGENLRGSKDEAAQRVAKVLVRHTEASARQTVIRSTEVEQPDNGPEAGGNETRLRIVFDDEPAAGDLDLEDSSSVPDLSVITDEDFDPMALRGGERKRPQRWARVLTGRDNCSFCVMLASRGAVYRSAVDAGQIGAAEMLGLPSDVRGFANRFHDNCDCLVVPVFDVQSWPGRDQAEWLYRNVYRPATKHLTSLAGGRKYKDNEPVQALEKWLREHPLEVPDIRAA